MGKKGVKVGLTFSAFCSEYRSGLGLVVPSSHHAVGIQQDVANALLYIPVVSGILAFVGSAAIARSVFLGVEWTAALAVCIVAEAIFAVWHARYARALSAKTRTPPPCDVASVVSKIVGVIDARAFLEGWFRGAPLETVRRGNLEEFVGANFYHKPLDRMSEPEREKLAKVVDEIEAKTGLAFAEGYNPDVTSYQHAVDDMTVLYRPGIFYVFVWAMHSAFTSLMTTAGYKRDVAGRVAYWYRKNAASSGAPVVFLHGLGPGMAVYAHVLQLLSRQSSMCIALELPWVACQWHEDVPAMAEVADSLVEIVDRHSLKHITLAGHSYGTFVAAAVHKMHPTLVHKLVLIDPVCLFLFKHDVVYNAVYRAPATAMTLGVSLFTRELHINYTLCRNFFWFESNLWAEETDENTVVFLSGDDVIVPSSAVRDYLAGRSKAKVIYKDGYHHAQALFMPWALKEILHAIQA